MMPHEQKALVVLAKAAAAVTAILFAALVALPAALVAAFYVIVHSIAYTAKFLGWN